MTSNNKDGKINKQKTHQFNVFLNPRKAVASNITGFEANKI